MKNTTFSWLLVLLSAAAVSGCGSDDSSGSGPSSCSGSTPIECRAADGKLLGCCPTTHAVCSADGLSCMASGSGGSAGSGGSGAASGGSAGASGGGGGATGGAAGSGGATGGTAGTGGASGGMGGATGGTGGATGGSGGATGGTGGGATGGTGGGATGGTGGGTGGASCTDQGFEPNETSATATEVGPGITSCDSTGKKVFAKLDGTGDVDWYTYSGKEVSCFVDPAVTLDVNAWVCMYFVCPGVSVSCKGSSISSSTGPGPGCCSPTGGPLKASPNCTGFDDSSQVYIRVDLPAKNECVPYSIDFHY